MNNNFNNQQYNLQNINYEQQIYNNQQIIQQQQQQIQQMMQQQQIMQQQMNYNHYMNNMNQNYQQKAYSQSANRISFDFNKFRINNMYSLIAAIILICSFFMGNIFTVISDEYYSHETILRFNLKEACDVFNIELEKSHDGDVTMKEWIASKLLVVVIAVIVVLIVGAFIDINKIRIVSLAVLTISFLCMFGTVTDEELTPGFSFIVLLIGIITGCISCIEEKKERNSDVYFKEFSLSADTSLKKDENWKCIECGRENPNYLTTCKCGTSKADSKKQAI